MPVTTEDLFDYLSRLVAHAHQPPFSSDPDITLRLLASRLYYAVYHTAKEIAVSAGYIEPHGASTHQALWGFFRERQAWRYRKIGDWGRTLHAIRKEADYDIHRVFGHRWNAINDLASDVLNRLYEFESDDPAQQA